MTGGVRTEETNAKQSESMKALYRNDPARHPMLGKKASEDTRALQREAWKRRKTRGDKRGFSPGFTGKKHSEESKAKMRGKPISDATRALLREAHVRRKARKADGI